MLTSAILILFVITNIEANLLNVSRDKIDVFTGAKKCQDYNASPFEDGCRCDLKNDTFVSKKTKKGACHSIAKVVDGDRVHFDGQPLVTQNSTYTLNISLACTTKYKIKVHLWNIDDNGVGIWQSIQKKGYRQFFDIEFDATKILIIKLVHWKWLGQLIRYTVNCPNQGNSYLIFKILGTVTYPVNLDDLFTVPTTSTVKAATSSYLETTQTQCSTNVVQTSPTKTLSPSTLSYSDRTQLRRLTTVVQKSQSFVGNFSTTALPSNLSSMVTSTASKRIFSSSDYFTTRKLTSQTNRATPLLTQSPSPHSSFLPNTSPQYSKNTRRSSTARHVSKNSTFVTPRRSASSTVTASQVVSSILQTTQKTKAVKPTSGQNRSWVILVSILIPLVVLAVIAAAIIYNRHRKSKSIQVTPSPLKVRYLLPTKRKDKKMNGYDNEAAVNGNSKQETEE